MLPLYLKQINTLKVSDGRGSMRHELTKSEWLDQYLVDNQILRGDVRDNLVKLAQN
jgi:hypothetical protein